MDSMKNNPVSAFFGSGYTERKPEEPKEQEPVWPKVTPSEWSDVAINVMGDLYEGREKMEMIAGEVIVDGVRKGKLPITSGTWFKILKGEYWKNPHDKKNTLIIVSKCGIVEKN